MKTICNENEVAAFISRFLPKFEIWGIIYVNRQKNLEALKSLGITTLIQNEIIKSIEVSDYVETIIDEVSYGDMWVFGKDYDGTELYIKIALGKPSDRTICISFHKAEHKIQYANKKSKGNRNGYEESSD